MLQRLRAIGLLVTALALLRAFAAPSYALQVGAMEKTLHLFCPGGAPCPPDGFSPTGGLIIDGLGNLYGTTAQGGTNGAGGIVFMLTPTGTGYTETVLYSFCAQGGANCTDGGGPNGGLVMDAAGNLYGTTQGGGNKACPGQSDCGVIFELSPNSNRTVWTETVLYRFCSQGGANCTDGFQPRAGLIMDGSGNLYGTTALGGVNGVTGTVFRLTPAGTYSVLHTFDPFEVPEDAVLPTSGVIMDGSGNLYGTVGGNGTDPNGNGGFVYQLAPNSVFTVLHRFCPGGAADGISCPDGTSPFGGVIMDGSGNLYGTTRSGGNNHNHASFGLVFKLSLNGSVWTETTLYRFCAQLVGGVCPDGYGPLYGVVVDGAGNLYGTVPNGGPSSSGVLYQLAPTGTGYTNTLLFDFGVGQSAASPVGALTMDAAGNLYGATGAAVYGLIAPPSFTLSVREIGTGTVTSSPAVINCPTTCAASFTNGTRVTLTATPAAGATFAGWSGGGCSGNQTCSVTLSAATMVTATFLPSTPSSIALAAAVLPASRSIKVGSTATAFATLINAGPGTATTCALLPATAIPASFLYQTTNPTTNAVTGTANTPVDIAQGAAQSFVFALTPSAALAPTDVAFNFSCANANPAPVISGVNTLLLSGSTTPVPDIVALAASGDPGYVDIPGATGTGVFAVATVNLGIDATITAAANTGAASLPVTLTVCQTNPQSGACLAPPAASVTTDIQPNATPTFGIFATGAGTIANSPGVNRVFVTFTDAGGVLRGETSVAVRTQ